MRESELTTHFKKLDMVNIRDRLSSLRNAIVRCQKATDKEECAYLLRELARDLRYQSDRIFEEVGEEEET